jgi:DNA polymerase delta subunit 3
MAKTTLKASDIFSDDEDDEDDNETEEKPPQVAEDLEVEEDIDMQDIPETETIEEEPKGTSVQPASMPSASVGKARRKVLKKKTTKNARGLLGK